MSLSLEDRLRALEDVAEIARLKGRYCHAVDGGWDRLSHNTEAVAALFTEDATWDAGPAGRAEGRSGIRALFPHFAALHFAFHCVTNPIIEVDGDSATGNWHLIGLFTHAEDGPLWVGGIYKDRFRRTPEGWRFTELLVETAFLGPPQHGWQDMVRQAGFHPAVNAA